MTGKGTHRAKLLRTFASMEVQPGSTIVVWFSCGAASAVAAKLTIEKYPHCKVRVVNNPIKNEDEDNRRFLKDVEQWIGTKIESATNRHYPSTDCNDVWRRKKYVEGIHGAPCTQELKKEARAQWEEANHHDYMVLGFTLDEKKRHERFSKEERSNLLPVLIEAGITKKDCFRLIQEAGIELPRIYKMGYPSANCIGCVKATSPTYWNHVRRQHPEIFQERATLSKEIGAKLVRYKGERIYLDQLPPEAKGRPMKNMDFECGIFCGAGERKG